MKDLLLVVIFLCVGLLFIIDGIDINRLHNEISISRDHEKRLAIENNFRQYEIAVLTDTVLKGK